MKQKDQTNSLNMLGIIFLFCLFATTSANTCGGNCPDNSCKKCVCPTTPDIVNITELCAGYDWDQSCCKCMATYLSNGNARQQKTDTQEMNRTGIWLFWNIFGKLSECDIEIPRPAPTPES